MAIFWPQHCISNVAQIVDSVLAVFLVSTRKRPTNKLALTFRTQTINGLSLRDEAFRAKQGRFNASNRKAGAEPAVTTRVHHPP